jgi:putative toxin-antitoxin system antitoxin component (TIGR02293 family)
MKMIDYNLLNPKLEIGDSLSDSEVLNLLQKESNYTKHILAIKELSAFNDDEISECLNISVRTLHSYRKREILLKENVKELVVRLLSVIKHGNEVFGNPKSFQNWLNTGNFYFDGNTPISYLKTSTGIKYVDDRLTAMEYGDNV